jgi:hypothetical protein
LLDCDSAIKRAVLCCLFVQVLYSKFGFMYTDIKMGEEEFILIREDDIIGV